jgi:phospholipid-transporting ATPase
MCWDSFYKNILFTLMPFWFSFYNGFSGQTLHDAWLITVYNMVFTAAPPFVIGIFEKDMDEASISKYPSAYVRIQVWGLVGALV